MKTITVHRINAFSIDNTGGNPAGVVMNADDLTAAEKQRIAAKARFNETAFVSRSAVADFKLEFFTPVKQIAHCGHATVAAFSYLKQKGIITSEFSSKETIDGTREILFKGNEAFMEQKPPVELFDDLLFDESLNAVNLKADDLIPGLQPAIVDTGNAFLIIPVKTSERLAAVQPNYEMISKISERYGLIGFYLFTTDTTKALATTRMFAPFYGIGEEAATGMAAGPLAGYLFKRNMITQKSFVIEQGRFMQMPSVSRISIELQTGSEKIEKIFAGGESFVSESIHVEID